MKVLFSNHWRNCRKNVIFLKTLGNSFEILRNFRFYFDFVVEILGKFKKCYLRKI